jgi:hypothetical protein
MHCFKFFNQGGKQGLLGHVPDIVLTIMYVELCCFGTKKGKLKI